MRDGSLRWGWSRSRCACWWHRDVCRPVSCDQASAGQRFSRTTRRWHERKPEGEFEPLHPTASGLDGDSGHKGPESVPDSLNRAPGDTFSSASEPGLFGGCSLHALNILRARLPRTTPYAQCQRAASPVCIDRRYCNRVGLRRPYWRRVYQFIGNLYKGFMPPLATAGIAQKTGQRSLHPQLNAGRSSWSTRSDFGSTRGHGATLLPVATLRRG